MKDKIKRSAAVACWVLMGVGSLVGLGLSTADNPPIVDRQEVAAKEFCAEHGGIKHYAPINIIGPATVDCNDGEFKVL